MNGVVREGDAMAYHFLSRFNPAWRDINLYEFEKTQIKPFEKVGLAFVNQLNEGIGFIDGASFTFRYLGRTFTADINDFRQVVIAESVGMDKKSIIERFYPGIGNEATLIIY